MRWVTNLITCGLGGLFVGLATWSVLQQSPSIDEVAHLPAGLSHWQLGKFELYAVNPPLVRMLATAPLAFCGTEVPWTNYSLRVPDRSEFAVGRDLIGLHELSSIDLFRAARITLLPFVLIGLTACRKWTARVTEERDRRVSGIAVAILFCVSPTLLGNASMITPDAVTCVLAVCCSWRFSRWTSERSWFSAYLAGIWLGLALLAKFTNLLFLGLSVAAFLWNVVPRRNRRPAAIRQWILIVFTSLFILNTGYGFDGTGRPLGNIPLASKALGADQPDSNNRFSRTIFGSVPIPVPECCLSGIDAQKRDFECGYRSYLMGEWKHGGWWYYYLIGFLVKEPIGFQLMLYVSILHGLYHCKRWTKHSIREWSFVVLPPLLVFGLVSSQTGFNHHMRYVLPAYPFLFIIAARTVTLGRFWKWFSYGCLTWQVASVLWFAPHWMSYFNEFAGGPKNGHDWLVDSNIDWGQDILELTWWQDEHQDVDLQAALFTGFDPKDIGLQFRLPAPYLKGEPNVVSDEGLRGPQPGWYAVSVCQLKGHYFSVPKGDGEWTWSAGHFTYFMDHFEPVDMIGYSIYIYQITPEQAAAVQAKLAKEEARFIDAKAKRETQALLEISVRHPPINLLDQRRLIATDRKFIWLFPLPDFVHGFPFLPGSSLCLRPPQRRGNGVSVSREAFA